MGFEYWMPISGFEGLYEVSNLGRVKSLPRATTSGRILKSSSNGMGYQHIVLTKNGKQKDFYVHRLVAEAVLPNPENLPEVNHKSEDKTDNRVENLEWCTKDYNLKYGTAQQRSLEHQHSVTVTNGVLTFNSLKEAAKYFNVGKTAICNCLKGRTQTCCGFSWSYVSNYQG